ncbi:MAG: restriction endonuclease subunit S [Pseudonocardiaceae bacterium]
MTESVFDELSWRSTTLGALCEEGGGGVQTGPFGSQLHASEYVSDGIPSVMPQNIGDNLISADGIARIAESDATRLSKYLLRAGDIVYSRRGDVERRALIRPENDGWLCGTGCLRVRLGDYSSSDPRFISYLLGTEDSRDWIKRHAVGATMPNLNTSILSSVPLMIPPPSVQQAIAEVLGALDDKIAANINFTKTVDDYLAATLLACLNAKVIEVVPLKEIADVNAETLKPSPEGWLRYIDIASVSVGHFDFPCISDWASAPSRARRRVCKGDTLWSTVRPNRRSHALNLSDDPLLVGSTGLAVLSPRETGFAYLYEVTKLPEFTTYLESAAEGSAYPAVRADRFGEAPVPLLPASAREVFESVAAPMREHTFSLSEQNRTLAMTRDALLPPLMSGKIRVKDAEKAVEEVV